jgi:hypothetical protein
MVYITCRNPLTLAFDVVGELAFGRKFGFLEEGMFILNNVNE